MGRASVAGYAPRMSARSPFAPFERGKGAEDGEQILSVAELDARLRGAVRSLGRVVVEGEVSGAKSSPNGHFYFSLKDEREDACVACVMWRSDALKQNGVDRIVDGARVQVRALADVYAKTGRLQLQVSRVVPAGLGDLLVRREESKRKLAAEGLFDPSRKRPIPRSPRVVGVVTSGSGAAFHDIVEVARRRGNVRIVLSSAPVQGPDAPRLLRRALAMIAAMEEVDVIIVGRGGGSAEDLAAFDDEQLVRAIARCPKPVVAAVGHEIDWSIACLVADVRAATPSQAAEIVVPDDAARRAEIEATMRRLRTAMKTRIDAAARTRAQLERRLAERHPRARLSKLRAALAPQHARLFAAMRRRLDRARADLSPLRPRLDRSVGALLERRRSMLAASAQKLDAISPLAVLSRGYAIALVEDDEGRKRAIVDAKQVDVGDAIEVRLHRGTLEATVVAKHESPEKKGD